MLPAVLFNASNDSYDYRFCGENIIDDRCNSLVFQLKVQDDIYCPFSHHHAPGYCIVVLKGQITVVK